MFLGFLCFLYSWGMNELVNGQALDIVINGIPDAVRQYIADMNLDLNTRVLNLEKRREDDVKVIMTLQREISNLKLENTRLKKRMDFVFSHFSLQSIILDKKADNVSEIYSPSANTIQYIDDNEIDHKIRSKLIRHEGIRKSRIQQLGELTTRLPNNSSSKDQGSISFYASASTTIRGLTRSQTVIFDVILSNTQLGNYNNQTGTFTCGAAGNYVFTWSIGVNPEKFVKTHLKQNGELKGTLSVYGADNWLSSSSSQTAILSLKTGDEINVSVDVINNGTTLDGTTTVFSGFLLH